MPRSEKDELEEISEDELAQDEWGYNFAVYGEDELHWFPMHGLTKERCRVEDCPQSRTLDPATRTVQDRCYYHAKVKAGLL